MADVITISDNSQIKFLHGTQEALDAKRVAKSGESGTFYLTNNTHRLYVGLSDGSIEAVNEGITTYANTESLPTATALNAGQFVYITADSILAVSNGQNWIQINANTDTLYTYGGLVEDDAKGTVTVTTTLTEQGGANRKPAFAFKLTGKNGITIVEGSENSIEVYGTKLAATVNSDDNAATIKLVNEAGVQQSAVAIKGGTNVTIADDGGAIEIVAADTKLAGNNDGGSALAQGFQILAKDTANRTSGGKIDPIIKYGDGGNASVHFVNGTATLDVYTKAQVDALRANFDAMEYKGVVSSVPAANGVQNGWTYKAGSHFEIAANVSASGELVEVQPGDLIIAQSGEGTTTIKWGYVPSGNEDTTYQVALKTQGIQLLEKKTGASTGVNAGAIEVLSGAGITVSPNADAASKSISLTVNHNTMTLNDPATGSSNLNNPSNGTDYVAKSETITVIDASQGEKGIDRDAYGHIEKVYTKTIKVYDTNARLTKFSSAVSADTNKTKATVSLTAGLTGSSNKGMGEQTATFAIESQNTNLQISNSGTTVQMSLVWGKF
jgi:hypothetical protein